MSQRRSVDSRSSTSRQTVIIPRLSHVRRSSEHTADRRRRTVRQRSVDSLSSASTQLNQALQRNSGIPLQVTRYCNYLEVELGDIFPNHELFTDAKLRINNVINYALKRNIRRRRRSDRRQSESCNNEASHILRHADSTLAEPSTSFQNNSASDYRSSQSSPSGSSMFDPPSQGTSTTSETPSSTAEESSQSRSSTPLGSSVTQPPTSGASAAFGPPSSSPRGFSNSQTPIPNGIPYSTSETVSSTVEPVAASQYTPTSPHYRAFSPSPPSYSPGPVYQSTYPPSVSSLPASPAPLYSPSSPSFSNGLTINLESEDEEIHANMPREEKLLFKCDRCGGFHETCHFCAQCQITLCSQCNETSVHPHPLQKRGLGLDRGFFHTRALDQLSENDAVKEFVLRFMKSVVHAVHCYQSECVLLGCGDMKRQLTHFKHCHSHRCSTCVRLRAFCCNNKFQVQSCVRQPTRINELPVLKNVT